MMVPKSQGRDGDDKAELSSGRPSTLGGEELIGLDMSGGRNDERVGEPNGGVLRADARSDSGDVCVEVHDLDRKAGKQLVHGFDGASATTRRAYEAFGER
jgi:hypothetical protein